MSLFFEALEQAEKARNDQEKKPEQPEVKVNGIGGAAAKVLGLEIPESAPTTGEPPQNGKPSTQDKGRSPSGKHSADSIQHSAPEKDYADDRAASASDPHSTLSSHRSPSGKHSAFSIQHSAPESDSRSPFTAHLSPSSMDQHLVSLVAPTSFEADQYRTLRHIVEQNRKEADMHILAITSPAIGDGKTITSINLAGSLAQAPDARVLLIDADLRRPSIGQRLGIHDARRKGLVDAVLDRDVTFSDIVTEYPAFNISVICSGPPPSPPYEVLKDRRVAELLDEARARFDFILIDTPPLVPFSDCRLIGKWVDGFLVVVSAHKTAQNQLQEGMNILEPEKIVGIVFNADDSLTPERQNYHYNYQREPHARSWNPFRKRRK